MPLIFRHNAPLFGIWKIEESSDLLLSSLDFREEYVPFIQNLKTEKRKQEWLACRVLLKELLGEELPISYHPDGAPFLAGSSLFLSISHTNGYAAVLLQEQPGAGIDIEYRSARVLKIRSRFMSQEEEAGVDPGHEAEHLLIHWCAKEALFKMIRQENVDFREHLHIMPFQYSTSGRIQAYETHSIYKRSYTLEYRIYPDFVLVYSINI